MLQSLIRSLGITFTVSAVVAYFLTHFEILFLKTFLLTTLIQFLVWYVISYINEQIIPSMGFQRVDCSPAGDLVIKFKILFPEKLSKESIDTLSNLLP